MIRRVCRAGRVRGGPARVGPTVEGPVLTKVTWHCLSGLTKAFVLLIAGKALTESGDGEQFRGCSG